MNIWQIGKENNDDNNNDDDDDDDINELLIDDLKNKKCKRSKHSAWVTLTF